jgi:hypothetical protein
LLKEYSLLLWLTREISEEAMNGEDRQKFQVAINSLEGQLEIMRQNPGEVMDWPLEARLRFFSYGSVDMENVDVPNFLTMTLDEAAEVVSDYKDLISKTDGFLDDDRIRG